MKNTQTAIVFSRAQGIYYLLTLLGLVVSCCSDKALSRRRSSGHPMSIAEDCSLQTREYSLKTVP